MGGQEPLLLVLVLVLVEVRRLTSMAADVALDCGVGGGWILILEIIFF